MFDYSIMIELEKIIRPKDDEKNFLIAWIYKYHNKIVKLKYSKYKK